LASQNQHARYLRALPLTLNLIKSTRLFVALGLISALGFTAACKREPLGFSPALELSFSTDTVFLDTVFQTIGSSTRLLKVYNRSDDNVRIGKIRLGRGALSFFRFNADGLAGPEVSDLEILAKDSAYVFLEVTAEVSSGIDLLYVDSLVFELGSGGLQWVSLVTLAKDAYFHLSDQWLDLGGGQGISYFEVPCNETWPADKPHVVYGYALVDSGCALTVAASAEVHFHQGSGIWVYHGGSLKVDPNNLGTYEDPAVFQGDRLEPFYEDIPGQWGDLLGGIFFMGGSRDNLIQNAILKNASIGIRLDSLDDPNANVVLRNVRIFNSSRVGIYGGFGSLRAENLVVGNSGLHHFYALGGRYRFTHCTLSNFWFQSGRNTPSVALYNFFEDNVGNVRTRDLIECTFANSIIDGSLVSELFVGKADGADLEYVFRNCALKGKNDPDDFGYDLSDPLRFQSLLLNENIGYTALEDNNYEPDSTSPAIDKGNASDAAAVPVDIRARFRQGVADLGAFEVR